MKLNLFVLFSFLLLIGCEKKTQNELFSAQKISDRVSYSYLDEGLVLQSGEKRFSFDKSELPLERVILLNSSLIGYFTELDLVDRIVGVSSPEYIFSEKVLEKLKSGAIENVGSEQKYNVEKIIALKPDAVLTNYISTFDTTYDLLEKSGIKVIFLDEYLENSPLDKSRYLLVFGALFGIEEKAEKSYLAIEKAYNELKESVEESSDKPLVITNELYGNQWFMPGGNTNFASFINDSGAEYLLKEDPSEKAVPLSFEEVLARSSGAKYWVNAGNHKTKADMLAFNPAYSKLAVFDKGEVYSIAGAQKGKSNDYFESGVVRSDLVLKDYVHIFHPQLLPGHSLKYFKKLD